MKKDIHPEYRVTEVTCTCGNTFTTRSTSATGNIHADVCSNCHPFYTGKQKILDTGGRVARFEARYAKMQKKDDDEGRGQGRVHLQVASPTTPTSSMGSASLSCRGRSVWGGEPDVRRRREPAR